MHHYCLVLGHIAFVNSLVNAESSFCRNANFTVAFSKNQSILVSVFYVRVCAKARRWSIWELHLFLFILV